MVDTEDLKSSALNRRVGSSPTPGTNKKNTTRVFFLFVPEEYDTCASYVGTRKSGVCFDTNQNNKEQEARNFCDDKNLLAEETPTPGTLYTPLFL